MEESLKKKKCFSLKEKYNIIKRIENGAKQSEICKELALSKSTVSTIWKKKDYIRSNFELNSSNVKKVKTSLFDDLDQCLLKWFTQKRTQNVTVSTAHLQAKAEEFGRGLQYTDFKCSESWIRRFKKRYNISSRKVFGEATVSNMNIVTDWLQNKWPDIRKDYKDKNIFNGDEIGLFFKLTPNNIHQFIGETCIGGKLSEERITVFLATNLTGTEKKELVVIGNQKNPRCFQNIQKLPVDYYGNKKSWMTSEIFTKMLRKWDSSLSQINRKIILLVDNCSAHPWVQDLQCIKLVFLPPNTRSELPPMDQGVIHSLKSNYRTLLLSKMIKYNEMGGVDFKLNILDAINLMHMAWLKVSITTLKNSSWHLGFSKEDDLLFQTEYNQDPIDISTDFAFENLNDFIYFDDSIVTREELNDEEIINSVCDVRNDYDDDNEDSNDDDTDDENDEEQIVPIMNASEAVNSVNRIRDFLQSKDTPQYILDNFAEVELYISQINVNIR